MPTDHAKVLRAKNGALPVGLSTVVELWSRCPERLADDEIRQLMGGWFPNSGWPGRPFPPCRCGRARGGRCYHRVSRPGHQDDGGQQPSSVAIGPQTAASALPPCSWISLVGT